MASNKYGKILTIILIILVIAILGIAGFMVYSMVIKPYNDNENIEQAMAQFDSSITGQNSPKENVVGKESSNEIEVSNNISTGSSGSGGTRSKTYYNGYVMLGYIEIPKTKIKYPIIEDTTVKALETSVAALYPTNAVLNSPGNVVIIGHNYRNGKFFSNNKNLSVGDKIYITGNDGKVEYIIYQIFEAAPTDTSFYGRDTGGVPEITLSTCTDDVNARLIILAKANI
ncbi:MAG: sortase [Clostridia bacterium]|nr:sortase [Clostridia bacterium]